MRKKTNFTGVSDNISDNIDKEVLKKKSNTQSKELLDNLKIGISISDNADLLKLGYSALHLQDVSLEFARYLLVHGATMIYGGDLRKDGFTYLFAELAKLYSTKERQEESRFKNYFAWPIHLNLRKSDELDFRKNRVEIVKLPPPASIKVDPAVFLQGNTNKEKMIWAKSMTYMREEMNAVCDARVFLGGKTENFKGKYPGIVEEALYALRDNKPVYFIGAYGGATREIANLVTNLPSALINEEYAYSDKEYRKFCEHWNAKEENKIDYTQLAAFFKHYGLQQISKANGLTTEENQKLFTTNNLTEIIFYILKGLAKVKVT